MAKKDNKNSLFRKFKKAFIPSPKQFGGWSIPSKVGYVVGVLTFLSMLISVLYLSYTHFDKIVETVVEAKYVTTKFLDPKVAEKSFEKGKKEAEQGRNDKAIKYYQKAIEFKPDYGEAYFEMGLAFNIKSDREKILECFSKGMELPCSCRALYMMGMILSYIFEEFDKGIECYQKAIELGCDGELEYNNLSTIYFSRGEKERENGNYTNAIEDFQKAIDYKPHSIEAHVGMGNALIDRGDVGDHDEANKYFDRATKLSSDNPNNYYNMGVAYAMKNDYDRAIESFTNEIKLNPNYVDAYYSRGLSYKRKGEYDLSKRDYEKAIEIQDDYLLAYEELGLYYFVVVHNYDATIKYLHKAIELKSVNNMVYFAIGAAYYNKGDYKSAILPFEKAIDLNYQDSITLYQKIGRTYMYNGKYERAREYFQKQMKLSSDSIVKADANMNLGSTYFMQKKYDLAIAFFNTALNFDSKNGEIYYQIGYAYFQKGGNSEKVIECLQKAKQLGYSDAQLILKELEIGFP